MGEVLYEKPTNMCRTSVALLLIALLVLLLSSCATMFNGTQQLVPFNSQPQGAEIWVDGEFKGTTPIEVNLPRGAQQHEVILKHQGQERNVIIERAGMSNTGSIGLAIDIVPGTAIAILGGVITGASADLVSDPVGDEAILGVFGLAAGIPLLLIGTASVAVPLVVDLSTGAFYELDTGEGGVFVDFE